MERQNANLMESILDKILEYQSRQATNPEDIMLMLGLVNLFGIISVMNKHVEAAGPVAMSRQGGTDPLLTTLLTTLMTQRMQGGPDQEFNNPGGGGLNPALLMSLMGNQGQRPDQALLMNLLAGMMNNSRPSGPLPQQVRHQGGAARPGTTETAKSRGVVEAVAKPDDPGGKNNTLVLDDEGVINVLQQTGNKRSEPSAAGQKQQVESDIPPKNFPGNGGGMLVWDKRLG